MRNPKIQINIGLELPISFSTSSDNLKKEFAPRKPVYIKYLLGKIYLGYIKFKVLYKNCNVALPTFCTVLIAYVCNEVIITSAVLHLPRFSKVHIF